MAFRTPKDIAIIFALIIIPVIFFSSGIASIIANQNSTANNSFFEGVQSNGVAVYKNNSDSVTEGLINSPGLTDTTSQENIFVKGYNSMLSIGASVITTTTIMEEFANEIGLDMTYVTIIAGLFLIAVAAVMITWLRGGFIQ